MWKSTLATLGDTEATKQACFSFIIQLLAVKKLLHVTWKMSRGAVMHRPQFFIMPMVHPPQGEVIFSVSISR
jgi:hypothetical protein